MFLNNLELKNFRNFYSLNLNLSPQVNIFFGQNAQGKTNLLESISVLCLGKSFRTKKEAELIQWENEACYISGKFNINQYINHLEIGIGINEKRVKVNGQITKASDSFGRIPVVIFSPDDLQLIKGGPQNRRDFIDFYLAQIEPKYRFVYYNFYKVLQQRNKLLKEGSNNPTELEVWDEQLIDKGSKVIKYRSIFIDSVKPFIMQAQQEISGKREELTLQYLSFNNQPFNLQNEEEIKERFRRELGMVKKYELDRRVTLVGPHREDLRITIGNNIELRNFGSQGQQRTASLALKLGLVQKIKESREEYPLLLLDDVMSEFDDLRKQSLLKFLISSAQTFLTSTSRRDFPIDDRETAFFLVDRGEIESVR
jgi:DNA replication and repair protein RecF